MTKVIIETTIVAFNVFVLLNYNDSMDFLLFDKIECVWNNYQQHELYYPFFKTIDNYL